MHTWGLERIARGATMVGTEQKKFLKIWSLRLPEMVFTAPHGLTGKFENCAPEIRKFTSKYIRYLGCVIQTFQTGHTVADCTKLFPDHTKCQHVQNYLLAVGRYYLYICQQVLHTLFRTN